MGAVDGAPGGGLPPPPAERVPAGLGRPGARLAEDGTPGARLALLDVLDRDGQVRQSVPVHAWPLHVGRALDNDVVLGDPFVAARHFSIEAGEHGLELVVGDTANGVEFGAHHVPANERCGLNAQAETIALTAGHTKLRLRLPEHTLAPELALVPATPRGAAPLVAAGLVLLLGLLFNTYLVTDPGNLGRALGGMLLAAVAGGAVWCGSWALLSKTFTRQASFGWHVRVFLFASLASLVAAALPPLLAFAFSWPMLSDFAFIGVYAVGATGLYFHLLAVEPGRRGLLKLAAVTCAVVGVGLTMWFNLQRTDQFGDELYMSHLFPPALRVARPVAADGFVAGLGPLQAVLDKKAKEPARGEEADGGEE